MGENCLFVGITNEQKKDSNNYNVGPNNCVKCTTGQGFKDELHKWGNHFALGQKFIVEIKISENLFTITNYESECKRKFNATFV